ncbi:Zinc finger, C2H2 [Artemisia annua]|uniref:Zinc finger, C2H2 n=1 Tax=Artemisia annua TaxID=35608 RepID=A0A2U1Q3L1_ARTAN|nr:Zinc finger, C2H2 [Artemisia annua]
MEVELQFTENMIRGKRTKRPRPCSPFDSNGEHCLEAATLSEEDEDMANCLILLAQSVCVSPIIKEEKTDPIRYKTEKINSRKLTDITSGNKSGYYVYECKTCNRSFPSFQALGGHRASHKKPKLNTEEKEAESSLETHDQNNNNRVKDNYEKSPSPDSSPARAQIRISVHDSKEHNNKPKVHECSICGSEFLSGQALGGHMRKHRPIHLPINRATSSSIDDNSGDHNHNSVFSLDLNLPPPDMMEDIVVQSKFESFKTSSQQQRLMFSSPALVDCPY